jgi:hypothetical protein
VPPLYIDARQYWAMILCMAATAVSLPAVRHERCPTPEQIDRLVAEFCRLESEIAAAYAAAQALDEPHQTFKERLILLTEEYGQPHATKSRLLAGASSELVATFGTVRSVDGVAVEAFRVALKAAGRTRILAKLFEECVSWRLVDGSDSIIRGEQLSDRLQAAWARCFVEKPRSPSLKVRVR